MSAPAPYRPAEHTSILACLRSIRRRLFLVRLAERLALALVFAGAIALPVIAARLLRDRFPLLALLLALLPLAVAAALMFRQKRWTRPTIPLLLFRIAAAIAAAAAVLAIALTASDSLAAIAPPFTLAILLIAASLIAAAATVRTVPARSAAIFVDQQVGLRERVSTALELLETPPAATPLEAAFHQPLVAAALAACATVRNAKVGYARVDRRIYPLAATAALAAGGLACLTPLAALAHPQPRPYVRVVETTNKLADKLREIEENKPHSNDPASDKALTPLKEALTDLRKGNMNPFEAQARLNEAKADLQKNKDAMDDADRVQKALANLKDMQQLAAAADKLKDANTGADSQDGPGRGGDARKNLQAAADAAASKTGAMSAADRKAAADDLRKAAAQAGDNTELQKSLDAAADAAQKGDTQQMSHALADAGGQMAQLSADRQLSGQALKDAMDAIDQANAGGKSADEQQAQANAGQNGGGDQQSAGGQPGGGGQQMGQNSGGNSQQQNGGGQQQEASGSGQQGGQGQQGAGQSGGQQQGPGNSGRAGDSQTASSGSTNFHQPGGPGDSKTGGPVGRQETFVKIYGETQTQTAGQTEKLQSQLNPVGPAAGTSQVMGQADRSDPTIKTYQSQLPAARQKAIDDLDTQKIPAPYRDVIRQFYSQ